MRLVGGPTAVLEIGGVRLLTDPTFDPAGVEYRRGSYSLVKTTGPALAFEELEPLDAVLLSHEHHPDNLDAAGREVLGRVPRVLTTAAGAERLGGGAAGLSPWDSVALGDLTVTAVPALHGPEGSEEATGPVVGFVLAGDGVPVTYVSGDNAAVRVAREIRERVGPVEVAVLFAGAARVPPFGDEPLTLTGERAAEAARVLGARVVVPVHCEGWRHFSEGVDEVRAAFAAAGLAERLVVCERGERVVV